MIGKHIMRAPRAHSRIERECNVCGRRYFAPANYPCPEKCIDGTLCTVITPLPGKRVSGVLCRDKTDASCHEISFVLGILLTDLRLIGSGLWKWPFGMTTYRQWTLEEWKEQYGKLPRKGSKQIVILELTSGK